MDAVHCTGHASRNRSAAALYGQKMMLTDDFAASAQPRTAMRHDSPGRVTAAIRLKIS
jgi:hypothetical protein